MTPSVDLNEIGHRRLTLGMYLKYEKIVGVLFSCFFVHFKYNVVEKMTHNLIITLWIKLYIITVLYKINWVA